MINGKILRHEESRLEKVFAFAVAFTVIALGFARLRFGLDLWDEGMWLSAPFRYVLGDMPIRNEWTTVGRWFDIIIWPVMKILPGAGSVLQLRYFGFMLHVTCIGALFISMRRFLSLPVLAACFAAALHINLYSSWTPNYYTMPTDFVCLAMTCILAASRASGNGKAILFGVLGGISFFLSIICYFPNSVLLGIIAAGAVYFLLRYGKKSNIFLGAAALFATSSIFLLCFIGILLRTGLMGELHNVYKILSSSSAHSGGVFRILETLMQLGQYVPAALALFFLFWALSFCFSQYFSDSASSGSRFFGIAAACAAVAVLLLISLPKILGGWMISSTAVYLFYRFYRRDTEPSLVEVLDPIVLFTLAWYGLIGTVSFGRLFTASYASLPMFIVFAIISERMISGRNSMVPREQERIKWGKRALALLFLLLAVNITGKSFSHTLCGPSLFKSTQKSTYGRMAGIYSSPQRISNLEELLRYLHPRVKEGDRLLSFDDFALLPYLTGTLPAMDTCFVDKGWPLSARELLLKRMIAGHHVPEYAVRLLFWPRNLENLKQASPLFYSEDPKVDPIFAFVKQNYILEKTIGPYEIWRRNQGRK